MEIEEAIGLITANTKKIEDRIEVALEDAYSPKISQRALLFRLLQDRQWTVMP